MIRKFRLLITVSLFVLVSACSSKSKDIKNQQAMLYFGAGTQSLMTQNHTDALTNLLKADELEPDNADIVTNLGMAYYFKGQTDIAISKLKYALKLQPKQTDAKLNLASIYYKQGDISEAEAIYKNVLKDLTYDKQARTLYNLGVLEAEKRKNYDAAESYFKQALKEDENYCPAFHQLGIIQYRKGQFNTAEKTFMSGTRGICVEFVSNYYYHALTLVELKRFEEARMRLEEIDIRFKQSDYASKARIKIREISRMGNHSYTAPDVHASRKSLESPDF